MLISLAAVLVAITLAVLAVFMIPTFIEIRKTAVTLRETTERAEREITQVLHDLHSTLSDIKVLVEEATARTDDVKTFMEALGETGRNLHTINHVVGKVANVLATSSVWAMGAKAAGRVILERLLKKRKEG
ncbi:MAG TPA: DUF948 domain-containing protein [Geobacteraceae bacterium]|nr:DUF948 domain-containing protein [Geobacteraceae bacterium]